MNKIWTQKDSYDRVMNHRKQYGHFPQSIGVCHWAYEYAVSIREMVHDPKAFKAAVEWAAKNIDNQDDAVMSLISKGKDDDIMRLAKKKLFIQHYEKNQNP